MSVPACLTPAPRFSIQEQPLRRHVKRLRGVLVCMAHILLYHSTLGSRVTKKNQHHDTTIRPFRSAATGGLGKRSIQTILVSSIPADFNRIFPRKLGGKGRHCLLSGVPGYIRVLVGLGRAAGTGVRRGNLFSQVAVPMKSGALFWRSLLIYFLKLAFDLIRVGTI